MLVFFHFFFSFCALIASSVNTTEPLSRDFQSYTAKIDSIAEIIPLSKEIFGDEPGVQDWFLFDLHHTIFVNMENSLEFVEDIFGAFFTDLKCKKGGLTFLHTCAVPYPFRNYFPKFVMKRLSPYLKKKIAHSLHTTGVHFDLAFDFPVKEVCLEDGILKNTTRKSENGEEVLCDKGEVIERLIQDIKNNNAQVPRRIYFLDDAIDNVNKVCEACEKLGINCLSICYPRMWRLSTLRDKFMHILPHVHIFLKASKNLGAEPLHNQWISKKEAETPEVTDSHA